MLGDAGRAVGEAPAATEGGVGDLDLLDMPLIREHPPHRGRRDEALVVKRHEEERRPEIPDEGLEPRLRPPP